MRRLESGHEKEHLRAVGGGLGGLSVPEILYPIPHPDTWLGSEPGVQCYLLASYPVSA